MTASSCTMKKLICVSGFVRWAGRLLSNPMLKSYIMMRLRAVFECTGCLLNQYFRGASWGRSSCLKNIVQLGRCAAMLEWPALFCTYGSSIARLQPCLQDSPALTGKIGQQNSEELLRGYQQSTIHRLARFPLSRFIAKRKCRKNFGSLDNFRGKPYFLSRLLIRSLIYSLFFFALIGGRW